jgi:hypothetical protein
VQPSHSHGNPKLSFDQIFLSLVWTFNDRANGLKGSIYIELGFEIAMSPSTTGLTAGFEPAMLNRLIGYTSSPDWSNSGTLVVNVSVVTLSMATLYNFFDSDSVDGVMSILKDIVLNISHVRTLPLSLPLTSSCHLASLPPPTTSCLEIMISKHAWKSSYTHKTHCDCLTYRNR